RSGLPAPARNQPFSCEAGEGLPSHIFPRRQVQPFSCEAGEGGAQRRMRARAKRAAVAPLAKGKIKGTLRYARAPSSALRAPSPVNGRRASFPHLSAAAGPALLLRSGRRWRAAPDEGASEASCCCSSGQRQNQRHASLRSRPLIRPPGTFSRKREKGFLPTSFRDGRPSLSPAKREKGCILISLRDGR